MIEIISRDGSEDGPTVTMAMTPPAALPPVTDPAGLAMLHGADWDD